MGVLTFRKGTGGLAASDAMVNYLEEGTKVEIGLTDGAEAGVSYYLRAAYGAAAPRFDMAPAYAAAMGIDATRQATHEEVTNLLRGLRADGKEIEGKAKYSVSDGKDKITFYDFTWNVQKEVSVAYALASTAAERQVIVNAQLEAVHEGMRYLQRIIGRARKGHGGHGGTVDGEIGWISYTHTEARPVIELPHTEKDGQQTTIVQAVNTLGDPHLHTHVITPNVVVCPDGSVGSLHTAALHDRVHEAGAYYRAQLATKLRRAGIEVGLNPEAEKMTMPGVVPGLVELFSKRTRKQAEVVAREHVAAAGLDWDSLDKQAKIRALKRGAKVTRSQKEGGSRDELAIWKAEALAAGFEHHSVINPEVRNRPLSPERERLTDAYQTALPMLDEKFRTRAVLSATVARTVIANALVATGIEDASDIDKVTQAMRHHGILHDGKRVPLVVASVLEKYDAEPAVKLTTTRALGQERSVLALARSAVEDRSGALTEDEIEQVVRRVSERDSLDFTTAHGLEQRRIIAALGTSGRLGIAVGVGGAGKTTLLRPLVDAWHKQGREVYGTALAYRQSDPLADAGVKPDNSMALAMFLARVQYGRIKPDENAVVIVDELSQIGTAQLLALLRLRERHGFTMIGLGDPLQNQAIEAGSSVNLLRKALGDEQVQEIKSSVRQLRDRDKETALMFREGKAAEGIERLREDGTALLVPGGREHAIQATADLWARRQRENIHREDYKLTVSAPTNEDCRAISAAIRERRRSAGNLGLDERTLEAQDQNGAQYDLPLAVGDRVRLFGRTWADDSGWVIGNNGSVVTVERVSDRGLQLRSATGTSGFVGWDRLADEKTGRIKLTYGDVVTLDAIQSATSTEHIHALPSGSAAVNSFRNYVGLSRARESSWLVASDGAERLDVLSHRALGNDKPVTEDEVWANVARNLARQPEKELATDLVARANKVHIGSLRSMAEAFQPAAARAPDGKPETIIRRSFEERLAANAMAAVLPEVTAQLTRAAEAAKKLADSRFLTGPKHSEQRQVRNLRRSVRPAASRPKRERPRISATEAEIEFREAIYRAGLCPDGPVRMDGQKHYTRVEGGNKSKRGFYIGYLDGVMPAGVIINHRTGVRIDWRASSSVAAMTPTERQAEAERIARAQAAREAQRRSLEESSARIAQDRWRKASPVEVHPYLAAKGVRAHGMRQDRRGNLLIPMHDADGKIWGLQTILPDGRKLYQKDARRKGTHALLGKLEADAPLVIAEGFVTAATIRETTGLAVAVAFDAGGLMAVVRAYRERDPSRPIVIAADNDHHLPGIEMQCQASAEGTVTVQWPAGATGKAEKGDTVEYRIKGANEWTLAAKGCTNQELEVSGLVANAQYEFRVFNSKHEFPLKNVGIEKAELAARAAKGSVLIPEFGLTDKGTDWNDYAAQHGKAAVRFVVESELRKHGLELPAVKAAAVSQADRDVARMSATVRDASEAAEAARRAQTMRNSGLSL